MNLATETRVRWILEFCTGYGDWHQDTVWSDEKDAVSQLELCQRNNPSMDARLIKETSVINREVVS